jgi:hypothetical protein
MRWQVTLTDIEWDDGKGDYDVSKLPTNVEIVVEAPDKEAALEFGMSDVSDVYGSLISNTVAFAERL